MNQIQILCKQRSYEDSSKIYSSIFISDNTFTHYFNCTDLKYTYNNFFKQILKATTEFDPSQVLKIKTLQDMFDEDGSLTLTGRKNDIYLDYEKIPNKGALGSKEWVKADYQARQKAYYDFYKNWFLPFISFRSVIKKQTYNIEFKLTYENFSGLNGLKNVWGKNEKKLISSYHFNLRKPLSDYQKLDVFDIAENILK